MQNKSLLKFKIMIIKRELTVRNYYQFLNVGLGIINHGLSQWQKQQQKNGCNERAFSQMYDFI